MLTRILAVIVVALMLSGTAYAADSFRILPNHDLPGNDLLTPRQDLRLRNISVDECKARCLADRKCRAFTHNASRNWCFLKSAAGTPERFTSAVSGVRLQDFSVTQEPSSPRIPDARNLPRGSMTFEAIPPRLPVQIGGSAWKIYADGVIDKDTANSFEALLIKKRIPQYSSVTFNSTGGNLVAGMQLGRIIREYGFNTYVGQKSGGTYGRGKGVCYSACALSFLGGRFRYANTDSDYGVHRFHSKVEGGLNSDVAQAMSAIIVQYIRDMGVDPSLFTEMTLAGEDDINVLKEEKLLHLGVINNGIGKTKWSIESLGADTPIIYLKGERDTVYGINKFMLICDENAELLLYIVFDPQGRADEVIEIMGAQSLYINEDTYPIAHYLIEGPLERNGWINAYYKLDKSLIRRLKNAKTVGVIFQFAYDAPIFLGFDDMEVGEGLGKLVGFISTCGR